MTLAPVNVVMAVYGQPKMLEHQLRTMSEYDDDILHKLKVIIVDDCGDPPVTSDFVARFDRLDLRVFRITVDVPWNQMGARNLGMHHADPTWCVMIDPDMVFSCEMMRRLMMHASRMRRKTLVRYHLRHVDTEGKPVDGSSPNTYIIHRDDFFAVGGYDEDFAGNKGWSDVQLLDTLKAHYRINHHKGIYADFHKESSFEDACVFESAGVDRKTAANRKLRLRKLREVRKVGGWLRWVKSKKGPNLRQPWIQVHPSLPGGAC